MTQTPDDKFEIIFEFILDALERKSIVNKYDISYQFAKLFQIPLTLHPPLPLPTILISAFSIRACVHAWDGEERVSWNGGGGGGLDRHYRNETVQFKTR